MDNVSLFREYTRQLERNLETINKQLYRKFEDLKNKCEQYTDCARNRYWGDYCWNDKLVITSWHYKSVPHTRNYEKLEAVAA